MTGLAVENREFRDDMMRKFSGQRYGTKRRQKGELNKLPCCSVNQTMPFSAYRYPAYLDHERVQICMSRLRPAHQL